MDEKIKELLTKFNDKDYRAKVNERIDEITVLDEKSDIDVKEIYKFLIFIDGCTDKTIDELIELLKSYLLFRDNAKELLKKLEG